MQNKNKRFNLIGFDFNKIDTKQYRHCSIHPYKRLLNHKTDSSLLFCPQCGSEYPVKVEDSTIEQNIKSDLPANSGTKIVQAKKKRKFRDSIGNPIPDDDKDGIHDMQGGKRIVYYHEQKAEENKDRVVSVRKYKGVSWSDPI